MTDLVQRLKVAASEAIEAERQALIYDPGRLRTVTVELEVRLGGNVVAGDVYVHRKGKSRRETAA